jgi:hypothetical protein
MMVQATHFWLGPLDPHRSRNAAAPRAARGLVTPGMFVSIPYVQQCEVTRTKARRDRLTADNELGPLSHT